MSEKSGETASDHGPPRQLFAISDIHLSFSRPKPMGIFGPDWEGHPALLESNWRRLVGRNDLVLLAGDISWGMRLPEALPDLEWLADLPGHKILIRGNHDYWWQSPAKLATLELPGIHFVQNNHFLLDGIAVGGTRLWDFPFAKWEIHADNKTPAFPVEHGKGRKEDPEQIRARELIRLEMSLSSFPSRAKFRLVMTHYPPLGENGIATPLTERINSHDVDYCVFGHIHGLGRNPGPGADCRIGKTRYILTACDHLKQSPLPIARL
ncbi:MAG: metallophosphoesterase [Planctomycetota bacterium]|jgi:predicted phosphohydrolase|nr:metallophosphoesterase [Planctomycetota bacterium]